MSPEFALPHALRDDADNMITQASQWAGRRRAIVTTMIDLAYGGLPPAVKVQCEELHTAKVKRLGGAPTGATVGAPMGATLTSFRLTLDVPQAFSFQLRLWLPAAAQAVSGPLSGPFSGPFPVVLTGDACWAYATDQVIAEVLGRGYALAQFNRVELASDAGHTRRNGGIYPHFPKLQFGALAAWAWGFHRCVDALLTLPQVDGQKIAVLGHSRGGKAALLAGATDERIALTSANNSGAGGAGCFRFQPPGSETLRDLLDAFPQWFGPDLARFVGKEAQLPFDQHFLKALIAPRALLTTEALDDTWANPQGTWLTHRAAREVYQLLGAPEQIAVSYREGGHDHTLADWQSFLDFADFVFLKKPRPANLDTVPFAALSESGVVLAGPSG